MSFGYNDSDDDASDPLIIRASERGDFDTIQRLIKEDPECVHETNVREDQPIHIACLQKNDTLLRMLIAAGADVNARGDFGKTPLHYAVFEGDDYSMKIAKRLLEAGADPNLEDTRSNSTPLTWAQREHDEGLDLVIDLLKQHMG